MNITPNYLQEIAKKLAASCGHQEYHEIQLTWTQDVWRIASNYFPSDLKRCLDLGAFTGINSIALSTMAKEVVAVDHQSYLPDWISTNVKFSLADLDSGNWELPSGPYNVCFMIEILEHLKWSPIPLLKWLNKNVELLVITTPDDDEWPAMQIHPWTQYVHYRYIPTAFPGCTGNPNPMFHVKQYKQYEFIELLTECNFRVLELNRVGGGKHQLIAICTPR